MTFVLERTNEGESIVNTIRGLCANPPGQTEQEQKKLIKMLSKANCDYGLMMWGALYGSIEIKQSIAKNPSIDEVLTDALMMDAEQAPWFLFSLLEQNHVFTRLLQDIYGVNCPYPHAEDVYDLLEDAYKVYQQKKWEEFIPKQGKSTVLQSELIRILWRFARIRNYCVAYSLDYEDEMFVVLNDAVERTDTSVFAKNVLKALLRWSQIQQRCLNSKLPKALLEPDSTVGIVVDVFLRRFEEPIPFESERYK